MAEYSEADNELLLYCAELAEAIQELQEKVGA